jgi:hypothetical protein
MAVATVDVRQLTGAGPTATAVTTPRLSTSDSAAPGTANPIPILADGLSYSYWMSLQLTITAMNDATLLNNHKFYSDGTIGWALGTGGKFVIGLRDSGDNGCPAASYDQATGTEGETGDDMEDDDDGHAYYKSQDPETGLVSAYSSAAKLTVDSGDHEEAEAFKHVVVQLVCDDDATRGALSAETLTFEWDEV